MSKDTKLPEFDSETEKAPGKPASPDAAAAAETKRAADIAAIHEERKRQAAVVTRFDASKFERKEVR